LGEDPDGISSNSYSIVAGSNVDYEWVPLLSSQKKPNNHLSTTPIDFSITLMDEDIGPILIEYKGKIIEYDCGSREPFEINYEIEAYYSEYNEIHFSFAGYEGTGTYEIFNLDLGKVTLVSENWPYYNHSRTYMVSPCSKSILHGTPAGGTVFYDNGLDIYLVNNGYYYKINQLIFDATCVFEINDIAWISDDVIQIDCIRKTWEDRFSDDYLTAIGLKDVGLETILIEILENEKKILYNSFSQDFTRNIELKAIRMNGPDIYRIQHILANHGFSEIGEVDGYYGPLSEGAIKRVQKSLGVEQNGKVDKELWDFLTDKSNSAALKSISNNN
jgi:hypothetical protein